MVSPRETSFISGLVACDSDTWVKPGPPGDLADPRLVRRVAVPVQADHRDRAEPVVGRRRAGPAPRACSSSGTSTCAVGADSLAGLDHPGVQQVRPDDLPVEDLRPVLVGDPQRVGETRGDDQDARLALCVPAGHSSPPWCPGGPRRFVRPECCCSGAMPSRCRMPATAGSSYAPGFSDSSLCTASVPSGRRATTSVNVPPRSIQNSQRPSIYSRARPSALAFVRVVATFTYADVVHDHSRGADATLRGGTRRGWRRRCRPGPSPRGCRR